MEDITTYRIVRIIAFLDEIWSLIHFVFTILTFFGGEPFNGLFYLIESHADHLEPEIVTGKKALTGLLFFLCLLIDLLWVFAAFMLFKGTEKKDCPNGPGSTAQKKLLRCKIWFYISILLLLVEVVNIVIYITDSIVEIALANTAFLARGIFMYFVQKYMRMLQAQTLTLPAQERYAPSSALNGSRPCDNNLEAPGGSEAAPFIPVSERNNDSNSNTIKASTNMVTTIVSADGRHRIILNHEPEFELQSNIPLSRPHHRQPDFNSGIQLYELHIDEEFEPSGDPEVRACINNNNNLIPSLHKAYCPSVSHEPMGQSRIVGV